MAWTELYSEEELAVGTHWTRVVRLSDGKNDHAIEAVVSGSGTVTITPYSSISGLHYISNGAKISGMGSSDGPDSDGKNNVAMALLPSDLIKFKVVVAGDTATLSLWFTQK